jgi:hypothetical protein
MGWVEMSERELRRAEVLASVTAGRLTVTAAAEVMRLARKGAEAGFPLSIVMLRRKPQIAPPLPALLRNMGSP